MHLTCGFGPGIVYSPPPKMELDHPKMSMIRKFIEVQVSHAALLPYIYILYIYQYSGEVSEYVPAIFPGPVMASLLFASSVNM